MSRSLALGSTLVHLVFVMVIAWVTGFLCDKGLPRMVTSGIVFIVAGALQCYSAPQSINFVSYVPERNGGALPLQPSLGSRSTDRRSDIIAAPLTMRHLARCFWTSDTLQAVHVHTHVACRQS
jgi:hypothetical protein